MDDIVQLLLDDYQKGSAMDGQCASGHPESVAVTQLLEKLQMVLFPGYFGEYSNCESRPHYISMLVADVVWRLEELTIPLMQQDPAKAFCMELPSIRRALREDLQAFLAGDPAADGEEEIIVSYPGFYAIWVQRLAHSLYELGVPLLPRMMTELAHSRTGIDIHPGAQLGHGLFIDHGTGVVIGQTTVIGEHVKIYQGVTLGAISTRGGQHLKGKKRHPTIEDAVTIYAGASILGGDTVIGKGAVIGANAFVTASVKPGTLVIGHRTDP